MTHKHIRRITATGRLCAVSASVLALGGCDAVSRAGQRLDARAVSAEIESQTQIGFDAEPPPTGVVGLQYLAGTLVGNTPTERIVVLDFFTAEGTAKAVGHQARLPGVSVLRRKNLVIFYSRSREAPNHLTAVRAALRSASYRK